jgi:hypothetical protein
LLSSSSPSPPPQSSSSSSLSSRLKPACLIQFQFIWTDLSISLMVFPVVLFP